MAESTPVLLISYYTCCLPVFKQGDDLASHLESKDTVAEAFEGLAQQYEHAAAHCRKVAGIAKEIPELDADAGTHHIGVSGPTERLDMYVEGGVLHKEEDFEEEALWSAVDALMEIEGRFTLEDAISRLQKSEGLESINPQWVREYLEYASAEMADALVQEGQFYRVVIPRA